MYYNSRVSIRHRYEYVVVWCVHRENGAFYVSSQRMRRKAAYLQTPMWSQGPIACKRFSPSISSTHTKHCFLSPVGMDAFSAMVFRKQVNLMGCRSLTTKACSVVHIDIEALYIKEQGTTFFCQPTMTIKRAENLCRPRQSTEVMALAKTTSNDSIWTLYVGV